MSDERLNKHGATPVYGMRANGDSFHVQVGCADCKGRWSVPLTKGVEMNLDRTPYRCPDCRSNA